MMLLVTLGSVLLALALGGFAIATLDRTKRVAVALVGAAGALLLVLSRPSTKPFDRQSAEIREACLSTANAVYGFKLEIESNPDHLSTYEQYRMWAGAITWPLYGIGTLCVSDINTCQPAFIRTPTDPRFMSGIDAIINAFRTGAPCPR
jgi:hypothetical protein